MDTQREFDGRTLEQAIQGAMNALGLERHELKYDILEYGSKGLFGLLGVKKARIRVRPPGSTLADGGISARQLVDALVAETGVGDPTDDKTSGKNLQHTENTEKTEVLVQAVCSRIVSGIVSDASVIVTAHGQEIIVDISGKEAGLLIGKHGQTLEAIHYLVEKIAHRAIGTRVHIQLDIEGYLKNRWANLKNLAISMAQKAKESGKPAVLGQMNARDRRVVHLALKDDQGIRTQSRGDGYLRKLIIFPNTRTD